MEKSIEELVKKLGEKKEILPELEKLWKEGDANKITAFIEKSGIKTDIETVEKALAEFQKKTVDKIKNGKIDDSQLEAVTGGGYGLCEGPADCDYNFKKYPNTKSYNRCEFLGRCDELFIPCI